MKAVAAIFAAIIGTRLFWSYRPESMRPPMRRRNLFGRDQCQIKKAGKWVKAPHASSRYQWQPVERKKPVVVTTPA